MYLKNFRSIFVQLSILHNFLNSFIVSTSAGAIVMILCTFAAYGFSKMPFPGSRSLFFLIIALMMVPSTVLMIPTFQIYAKLRLVDNYIGLITGYTVICLPYSLYLLKSNFDGIPDELIAAARIDGAGFLRIVRNVVVPMGVPALITVALINFLWTWNEVIMALLLQPSEEYKTVSAMLATVMGRYATNIPVYLTGLFASSIPLIILYVTLQRQLVQGLTMGALK